MFPVAGLYITAIEKPGLSTMSADIFCWCFLTSLMLFREKSSTERVFRIVGISDVIL